MDKYAGVCTFNRTQTANAQQQLIEYLSNLQLTHYLTVDLPVHLQHLGFERSCKQLSRYIKRFEKEAAGRHWNNHHIPFVGFAERGPNNIWHWHLLLWAHGYTDTELHDALRRTLKWFPKLTDHSINLQSINATPTQLYSYSVKEIISDHMGHINPDRFITSEILFNLPYKHQ